MSLEKIIGGFLALTGIKLLKDIKKQGEKNEKLINVNNKYNRNNEDIKINNNIDDNKCDYSSKLNKKDELEIDSKKNEYIINAENIIKNIETFENAKIIHGIINNTIAFNEIGYIFVTSYGKSKLIEIDNLLNLKLECPKKDDFPPLYYCVLSTNDVEIPEFKLLLSFGDINLAVNLFHDIETSYKMIKEKISKSKTST